MKRKNMIITGLMMVLFMLTLPVVSHGAAVIGKVTRLRGTVQVFREAVAEPLLATRGMDLQLNDRVRTAADASLRIELQDGSILTLGEKAHINLDNYEFDADQKKRNASFEMMLGKVKVFARDLEKFKATDFKIRTSTAVVGVRGTLFMVEVLSATITRVTCFENKVEVYNVDKPGQFVTLGPNQSTAVILQNPPTEPILMTPKQLQQIRQELNEPVAVPPKARKMEPLKPFTPVPPVDNPKPSAMPSATLAPKAKGITDFSNAVTVNPVIVKPPVSSRPNLPGPPNTPPTD